MKKIFTINKKSRFNCRAKSNFETANKSFKFFLGKNFFDESGFPDLFVYHPTHETLELKKTRALIMFLFGNKGGYILLNLSHYILLSYIV